MTTARHSSSRANFVHKYQYVHTSKVNSTVADVHTFLLSCQNYNVLVSQTTPMRSPAAEASTRSSKPRISGANTRKSNPPPPLDEGAAPSTPVQVNKRPLYKSSKICARVYFLYFSFLLLLISLLLSFRSLAGVSRSRRQGQWTAVQSCRLFQRIRRTRHREGGRRNPTGSTTSHGVVIRKSQ